MTSDIHSIDVLALAALPDGATPASSSLDEFYTVLASNQRRRLLDHLASVGRTRFDALVDAFAGEYPTRSQLEKVIYHVHLPRLVDAGMVDARDGVIDYDPPASFEQLFDYVEEHSTVDEGGTHSADDGFELLANARRREMIALVEEHNQISLPDVADEVTVSEAGTSIVEVDPETVLDVYLSLYHDHVPRLEEAGLVHYDQELDLVAFRTEGASHAASAE
ncbi:hypothetical protein ACFPYI_17405 [Halomarina salina]|uniref:DUF7344 domain-containing protein n=1 Tax=Halomarina salina TaxID=1872699 RepID=A0ABD5RRG4_9EURY|nr:hypothetical protein [Halomarina salina]